MPCIRQNACCHSIELSFRRARPPQQSWRPQADRLQLYAAFCHQRSANKVQLRGSTLSSMLLPCLEACTAAAYKKETMLSPAIYGNLKLTNSSHLPALCRHQRPADRTQVHAGTLLSLSFLGPKAYTALVHTTRLPAFMEMSA